MTYVAAMILAFALQDQDRIPDLIRKLGSDDFTTREQATAELKKIGKPATEALKKAAEESEDPEVRQRAQGLIEELAKAEKPAPRRVIVPPPGQPGFRVQGMSSVMVKSVNGNSTYTITPGDGSPVLTFHKAAAGSVKLEYLDEKNEAKSAESPTLETFLKDHKDLAQKYGITEDGITYAGSRVGFKGGLMMPNLPQPPRRVPRVPVPPAPIPDDEEEGTAVAGALLLPVEESLRAQLDIPERQGAVVSRVAPGSAAEALGLRKNDVLLEAGGKKIVSPESAKGQIAKDGTAVVLRKGKRETLGAKKDF